MTFWSVTKKKTVNAAKRIILISTDIACFEALFLFRLLIKAPSEIKLFVYKRKTYKAKEGQTSNYAREEPNLVS